MYEATTQLSGFSRQALFHDMDNKHEFYRPC